MDTRKLAIALHLFIAGWMFLNAFGHEAHVLYKHARGTLRADLDVGALLLIGAGLAAVGVAFALSAPALMGSTPVLWPAYVALGVLGGFIAVVASHYGFRFLTGSVALAALELGALSTFALRNWAQT